jgi:hypothetical protein
VQTGEDEQKPRGVTQCRICLGVSKDFSVVRTRYKKIQSTIYPCGVCNIKRLGFILSLWGTTTGYKQWLIMGAGQILFQNRVFCILLVGWCGEGGLQNLFFFLD